MRKVYPALICVPLALSLAGCGRRETGTTNPAPVVPALSPFRSVVTPTDREDLDPASPGTFQPTASGNPSSGLYGSVRTRKMGAHVVPSFHEGVDIAPLRRNARGAPLDLVRAVSDGTVAYVNRYAGNSDYGNYVVLTHADPLGDVYTLYAHLAQVAANLHAGRPVRAGDTVGRMGHTPPSLIPAGRAHLHFEIGLIANARFDAWFKAKRLLPDHGIYNGLNLQGVSPLEFFRVQAATRDFDFRKLLAETPVAFELALTRNIRLDYFRRYPALWTGAPFKNGWMVLACSEGGVVLGGRAATVDEIACVQGGRPAVLKVDEQALGRNGRRLVVRDGDRWRMGATAAQWLDILEY